MRSTASPISWAPRPASWPRPRSRVSCRASGGHIISAMLPGRLAERGRAIGGRRRRSIIWCAAIRPSPRRRPPRRRPGRASWNFSSAGCSRAALRSRDAARLAKDYHVLPEFLGNRSPFADPDARAIDRRPRSRDARSRAWRRSTSPASAVSPMAWPTWSMRCARKSIQCGLMVISGGAAQSPLVRQIMADTTGLAVALPATPEPVLLGSAMLGAVAAQKLSRRDIGHDRHVAHRRNLSPGRWGSRSLARQTLRRLRVAATGRTGDPRLDKAVFSAVAAPSPPPPSGSCYVLRKR